MGAALRVDRLIQFETWTNLARGFVTRIAVQPPEDEAVELCVVAGQFESQWSRRPPQSNLGIDGCLEAEIGVADVEVCRAKIPAGLGARSTY